jgi:Tol biopolymer transport system component
MNGENDVYVHDLKTGKTSRVSVTSSGDELNTVGGSGADAPASISGNGRYVAFESYAPLVSGDSNDVRDIYVHDRKTQKTRRVSLRSNGEEVGTYGHQLPSISKDGRWIAFSSLGEFTGGDSGVDFDVFERGPLH